jgi:acetolactate synthase-1/2/3 large subunit
MSRPAAVPAADLLVRRLIELGVRQVFGYPGGQLTPVYDAIHRAGLRHYLARDEQAAAFMADGFARATGRPGVCLAVCGPGVFNAFTPLASAHTDSIPLLLLSGQIARAGRGLRSGYYHENDQLTASIPVTKARFRVEEVGQLVELLDQAWHLTTAGRPGPVLLEVPLDVLASPAEPESMPPVSAGPAVTVKAEEVQALAGLMATWRRPLLLAGGGVVSAGAEALLQQLAERLGAPVFHTAMAKGVLPADHPLCAGMPWRRATSDLTNMQDCFSPLFTQCDGLLALGCRFSQLLTGTWSLRLPPSLAQVDIDPEEIGRHYPVTVGLAADARAVLEALLPRIPKRPAPVPMSYFPDPRSWRLPGIDVIEPLRRVLPDDAILCADVTRMAYILMVDYPARRSRTFLHPAGAVAMGYGIPAALGARAAWPDRKVLAIVGDGGFLMSGMELATAVQERVGIVVVLINDNCLSLIKSTQQRRFAERYIGVHLANPDFAVFAQAFGVSYWRADTDAALEKALKEALSADVPTLIEVRPGDTWQPSSLEGS